MNSPRLSLSEQQFTRLNRSVKIILIADVLLLAGTCTAALAAIVQASGIHSQLRTAQREVSHSLSPEVAPKIKIVPKRASKAGPVQAAQDRLIESASNHGCRLGDVETSAEPVPYASPFILGVSPPGWNQVTVRATVFGSIDSIVGTLHDLRISGIPIELDSVDLSRQDISPHGDVTLQAQFVFVVLLSSGATS